MNYIPKPAGLAAALILGACSSATTTAPVSVSSVGSVAKNAATGGYSVTVNGTTTDLGVRTALTTGGLIWSTPVLFAYAFDDGNVAAAGGMITATNTPFAGVTGTVSGTPATATYTGRIGLVGINPATGAVINQNSNLSLNVDTTANTVSQNAVGVTIDGTIVGSAFTGSVSWSGLTAPMAGGFYGTNTAAGAFSSPELAGAFLGTRP